MHAAAEFRTPIPQWLGKHVPDLAGETYERPRILRFASDRFMDDLTAVLSDDPSRLSDLEVGRETWRGPIESETGAPPKLFQPVHGRFYLLTASLVCRRLGFPDRFVDSRRGESVSMVLRRVVDGAEQAWVVDGDRGSWSPVSDASNPRSLEPNEERLPAFRLGFEHELNRRTIWAALLPVGRREELESTRSQGAGEADPVDEILQGEPRATMVQQVVVDAAKNLAGFQLTETDNDRLRVLLQIPKEGLLVAYADFGLFLENLLGWAWLNGAWSLPESSSGQEHAFSDAQATVFERAGQALELSRGPVWSEVLEPGAQVPLIDDWLGFGDESSEAQKDALIAAASELADAGESLVEFLRNPENAVDVSAFLPPAGLPSSEDALVGSRYVARVVYERPECVGRDAEVSRPSQLFTLAHWLDPDAPARPTRLSLPIEASPRTWSQYPRSFAVALSRSVRSHMNRVKNLADLETQSVGPQQAVDFGIVCSLSIPIVTLVALILLIIIVYLLDIVFWWRPYLMMCFPVRSSK